MTRAELLMTTMNESFARLRARIQGLSGREFPAYLRDLYHKTMT